jgi:hypothetical protein
MASLDEFKANIQGGGARANQFRITLGNPPTITGVNLTTEATSFMIKAASLPGQTITEIPVNFRGRQLFLAGDRVFETWTTTVINDTNFAVRRSMENWMNGINNLVQNTGEDNVSNYTSDMRIEQLDRNNQILYTYRLKTCWPTVIAPIDLNYDTVSEIETFDVTWRYTEFSVDGIN